ncbi:hypothetical protein D3C74_482110 [compost metagenome]
MRQEMRLVDIQRNEIRLHSRSKPADPVQKNRLCAVFGRHQQRFRCRNRRRISAHAFVDQGS